MSASSIDRTIEAKDITVTPELIARFWSYVEKTATCWLWRGGRFSSGMGYGQFRAGKRKVKAHRFAYVSKHGQIDPKIRVLHYCDNPICIRDEHHFLGTSRENSEDMARKGRASRDHSSHRSYKGTANPAAKITPEIASEVRERRKLGETYAIIGAAVFLSQSQIANIVHGRCWNV